MTGESLVRRLSKDFAVNAMSQEGSISKPILEIFKTFGRKRSLLAGEFLVWSSLCKARRQECQSLVTRINVNFFKEHICIQSFYHAFIILFPQLRAQHRCRCSILPGTGTVRESKVSSTLLGLEGSVL